MNDKFKLPFIRVLRKLAYIAAKPLIMRVAEEIRQDLLGAQLLLSLPGPYIPYTRPALSVGAIALILNDIIINQRKCIVECGGGVSTIYMARLIEQQKSAIELITVEHDKGWLEMLQRILAREQLSKYVQLIHAPLCPSESDHCYQSSWYNPDRIDGVLDGKSIDMLIIDGPPSSEENPYARYSTLPYFSPFLSEHNSIVLDDIRRGREREIAAKWQKQFDVSFTQIGSIGYYSSKDQFKPFL